MLTELAPARSEHDVDELKRALLRLLYDPDVRQALALAIANDLEQPREKRRLFV